MTYSGSGTVEDALVVPTNDVLIPPPAEPGSTSGCEASDFPAEVAGNVALIQRGTCTFAQKAQNAEAAGAVAAIIFNEGQEGIPNDDRTGVVLGTLGELAEEPGAEGGLLRAVRRPLWSSEHLQKRASRTRCLVCSLFFPSRYP